jgi:coiled-coil domain-containing protein 55
MKEEEEEFVNVFGEEEDQEEDQSQNQSMSKKKRPLLNVTNDPNSFSNLIAQRMQQEALKQDPSVFQFDEVYDNIQKQKEEKEQNLLQKQLTEGTKSKYIENLVKIAQERKKERERARDRKLAKILNEEKAVYGETEVFVTSSYKKKLQEQKKWEEEERRKEEQEQDVTKSGMMGYYRISRDLLQGKVAEKDISDKKEKQYSSSIKRPLSSSVDASSQENQDSSTSSSVKFAKQDPSDTVHTAKERSNSLENWKQKKQHQ